MADDDQGLLDRVIRDPVRLRRPASYVGAMLSIVSGVLYVGITNTWAALFYGMTWLGLLPVAVLLGYGNAFFIQHGRGVLRAAIELISGIVAALSACAMLSTSAIGRDTVTGEAGTVLVAALLYLAVFRGLAAGVGLGYGRGAGYLGARIQDVDDDW